MLTMLGLTNNTDSEFDSIFFKRIERIGLLSTITLIAGVLLMLFLSVPVQESKDVPASWYKIIYYVLISYIAILSGLIVGVVLMLFNAIRSLIDVVKPTADEDEKAAEEREETKTSEEKEEIDESGNSEEN
jgi:TRAP-type C4-dicarboxylate transport system permease small subunit